LQNGTILDGIAELTRTVSEATFSFEVELGDTLPESHTPIGRFSLDLRDQTVSQILNELCRADQRYKWSRDGWMINVFPAKTTPSYLLNRNLERLSFTKVTNAQDAVFITVKQLPAPFEQIAVVQPGGNISYSQPWTSTFDHLTVRQAFNRVAEHVAPRTGWIFGGRNGFRTVMFYTGELHRVETEAK